MKKVLIIGPSGNSKEYEVDGFELSSSKYEGYELVLILLKEQEEENLATTIPITATEVTFELVPQPSKKGIINDVKESFSEPLRNLTQSDMLVQLRESREIVFLDSKVSLNVTGKATISTLKYSLDRDGLNEAIQELIDKEKILTQTYQMQILKEALVVYNATEDKFYIREEVNCGHTEVTKV
jgi:hypothetical protein